MICIKVPATTANLGVGFDCLGMALDIYSYFYFKPSKFLQISGCPTEYQNDNNLVYQAYLEAMTELGLEPSPIKLVIKSDIPLERGLGSSSACVVAGVLGAYALAGQPVDQEKILALCTKIEGHPDNVA
ncbi:MAG: homoserine kinase, partial [Vagococcus sp.]